jgi:hypothetical protein
MITQKDIDKIMQWCFQNNTIKFKNTNLELAILDGGWVNVIQLKTFLESIKE